jgi:hypothetical protein
LTTFAGGWIVLPAPINWNYVFANLDFAKNKTIYLTIIIIAVLYILTTIYARYKDKKDVEKVYKNSSIYIINYSISLAWCYSITR